MTKTELAKLKELAERATPYGKVECPYKIYIFRDDKNGMVADVREQYDHGSKEGEQAERNYDFMIAANPATILSLLDRLQRAEADAPNDGPFLQASANHALSKLDELRKRKS